MEIELMEMGGNGNVERHSRTSLVRGFNLVYAGKDLRSQTHESTDSYDPCNLIHFL